MISRQSQLQEDTYFKVMRLLKKQPHVSQRELAHALGISLGAVNYCLKAMLARGWIRQYTPVETGVSKVRHAYRLTDDGATEQVVLARRYLERKRREHDVLGAEIQQLSNEFN